MQSKVAIQVEHATIGYGRTVVLSDISFSIAGGGITMIIGPNGSGKTTLLRTIAGLLPPAHGRISIYGQSPSLVRETIGYVPQRFQIDRALPITVEEFLKLSSPNREMITGVLYELGVEEQRQQQLRNLSGGQQQRVLIARALLENPDILLLDEPVAGIDITGEESIYRVLKHIQQQHTQTIVMISHEIEMVNSIADEVLCINKKLLCQGAPNIALNEEVLARVFGSKQGAIHTHHHV